MYWAYPYSPTVPKTASVSQREERVFSEDLLQRNVGRTITVFLTFENNPSWNAKKITGTLRNVGRDYILVRDKETGKDHLFLNVNVDYILFEDRASTP